MTFPTDYSIAPAELGRAAEDAGFESLLFAEHTHIPVEPRHAVPARRRACRRSTGTRIDPFVALATVAQATERLRLGTGICLVVERDPIITAKEVASLDFALRRPRSSSASAAAGTARRCATTAPTRDGASRSCASACWP